MSKTFKQELTALIRKHVRTARRMSDVFPALDALDQASDRLARETDARFPEDEDAATDQASRH